MLRVSFKTLGCKLNKAETSLLIRKFLAGGAKIVQFGQKCEIVVIHSCAVTGSAVRDSIRIARSVKRMFCPPPLTVIIGCAVSLYGESLKKITQADIVLDNSDKMQLLEILKLKYPYFFFCRHETVDNGLKELFLNNILHTRAFVKIQDGCNFCCSYCIIPALRGLPRSIPSEVIINECKFLAEKGIKEIVLTGINIGLYRDGSIRLPELLDRLNSIDGIERIRLSSLELSTVERYIVDFIASSEKMARYLHIPLQSGDDNLLKCMGRRYTVEDYFSFVEYAQSKLDKFGLGTDLIVGLPGEDDVSFETTYNVVKKLPFTNIHVFKFDPRPGTKAERMEKRVSEKIKKERSHIIRTLAEEKKRFFAQSFVGKNVNVLVEQVKSFASGWTSEYVRAYVVPKGNVAVNTMLEVKCVDVDGFNLVCRDVLSGDSRMSESVTNIAGMTT